MTREYQEATTEYMRSQKMNPIVSRREAKEKHRLTYWQSVWCLVRGIQGQGYGYRCLNRDGLLVGLVDMCCAFGRRSVVVAGIYSVMRSECQEGAWRESRRGSMRPLWRSGVGESGGVRKRAPSANVYLFPRSLRCGMKRKTNLHRLRSNVLAQVLGFYSSRGRRRDANASSSC
jgi:hypothetical protein